MILLCIGFLCLWNLATYWASVTGVLTDAEGDGQLTPVLTRLNCLPREQKYSPRSSFDGDLTIEMDSVLSPFDDQRDSFSYPVPNNESELDNSRRSRRSHTQDQKEIVIEDESQRSAAAATNGAKNANRTTTRKAHFFTSRRTLTGKMSSFNCTQSVERKLTRTTVNSSKATTSAVDRAHCDVAKRGLIETMKVCSP